MEIDIASWGRAALFLGIPFVLMVFYLQWKWARTCKGNIQVLIVRSDGSSWYELCPKSGGSVSLKNPKTSAVKMWPINKLSTIDVLYPGVGFIPAFMQKQIRMTIVDEDDWEPLINRSPDKEMIASPAVLGNLMHEKITEAIITVNKEMLDNIAGLTRRLNRMVSPAMFYIGIGVVIILLVFVVWQVVPALKSFEGLADVAKDIGLIKQSLGVK